MNDYRELATKLLDLYKFPEEMELYDYIYIYGAGMVGQFVFEYLSNHSLQDKISCFFTSAHSEDTLFGKPVKAIKKKEIDTRSVVLLAAKRSIRKELISVCQEMCINNIREVDVLDDRDYEYYSTIPEGSYRIELENWYKNRTGRELDLDNPQTFNEKMNWLKLYERDPRKTWMSDKYAVREWIKETIGNEYLVPLLGKWEKFDDIDFSALPDSFVLKCNHGCGYNAIVRDKKNTDLKGLKTKFDHWILQNYAFVDGFQMHYSSIKPCIIAEEMMENSAGDLYDYKFWCFDGKVRFVMFLAERQKKLKMNNYDLEWNLLPFTYDYDNTDYVVEKPHNLKKMICIAETLSKGFNHVRVDLYELNDGTIKFGEMTFTSCTGACQWKPLEMDRKLGNWLNIGMDGTCKRIGEEREP